MRYALSLSLSAIVGASFMFAIIPASFRNPAPGVVASR